MSTDLRRTAEEEPCKFCHRQIAFAIDSKRGNTVMLEYASDRSWQFLVRGGKASWWGRTGGDYRKHECPNLKGARR